MARDRMSISWDDLNSESVEKKLQQQEAISQARNHYDHAQIAQQPQRKPRFSLIYNTIFYRGLFGALGGLIGWGFGILLHRRPNAQQEARTLIANYEQIERQRNELIAGLDLMASKLTGLKKAEVEALVAAAAGDSHGLGTVTGASMCAGCSFASLSEGASSKALLPQTACRSFSESNAAASARSIEVSRGDGSVLAVKASFSQSAALAGIASGPANGVPLIRSAVRANPR